jgi:hypothetical protein
MQIVLLIFGIASFFHGWSMTTDPQATDSAFHQILAAESFIVGAIFISAAFVIGSINKLRESLTPKKEPSEDKPEQRAKTL